MIDGVYDFHDLSPSSQEEPKTYPSEAMLLDGKYIEDQIDGYQTLTVSGRELIGQTLTSTSLGTSDGETLQYSRQPSRTITVKYRLTASSNDAFRLSFKTLNSLLRGNRKKAIFNDDQASYWTVTLSDVDTPDPGTNSVVASFSLFVPDGKAHSVDANRFDFDADGVAEVANSGTCRTPIDVHATFTTDANSIGFVSADNILQFGTAIPEDADDDSTLVPSTKVLNDKMGSATKSMWTENLGRIRWRYDDGDHTSKIDGALAWAAETVSPSSFGAFDAKATAGYWHGPTLTRLLTTAVENVEVVHHVQFKATGTSKQRASCQGLLEINYSDADNNFVFGFEMKDNTNTADSVTYSFFIGDTRMGEYKLPRTVLTRSGGFFGSVSMKKLGNQFTFQLIRLNGSTGKQIWASSVFSWTNTTVAMLKPQLINMFMAQWRDFRSMDIQVTDTRITQLNTEDDSLIPLTFYAGDELFVDGTSNQVFINGIRNDAYRVIGSSQMFKADPGTTEITAVSDGQFTGYLEERNQYL